MLDAFEVNFVGSSFTLSCSLLLFVFSDDGGGMIRCYSSILSHAQEDSMEENSYSEAETHAKPMMVVQRQNERKCDRKALEE